MAFYFVLVSLVCLISTVTLTYIEPEVIVKGNPYVLAIIDFHSGTSLDEQCKDLSRRSVDSLMSLQWSNEMLNRNSQSNIGLLVYNSCGSPRRTIQILGQHVTSNSCDNTTVIAGVLTMADKEIQTIVEEILQPFGIMHVGISSESYITFGTGFSLHVAGVSIWKIQGVIRLLDKLHWKKIKVFAANHIIAQTERDLFLEMAAPYEICSQTLQETELESAKMNETSSDMILLFLTGMEDLNGIVSKLSVHSDNIFLLIGDSNIESINITMKNNTFILLEQVPVIENLYEYLQTTFSVVNETDPITTEFTKSLPHCERNPALGRSVCNNTVMEYWTSRLHDRTFLNIHTAYFNIYRIITEIQVSSCTGYDLTKCPQAANYVGVRVQQNNQGYPVQISPLINGSAIVDHVPLILIHGPTPSIEVARVTNGSIINSSSNLSNIIPSSGCSDDCNKCGVCYNLKEKDPVPGVVGYNGDIVLSAGFPIFKDSKFGRSCSELSLSGLIMAQSFLYAIETAKDRYASSGFLQGVKIGALIYDTCDGKTMETSQIMSNVNCPPTFYDGQSNVTFTGKIVSNIEYTTSMEKTNEGKLTRNLAQFKVSSAGLYLSSVKYDSYIDALVLALKSFNWTYVSIVYSKEFIQMETVKNRISKFKDDGICISDVFIINENIDEIVDKVLNSTNKTGAVILLTSKQDNIMLNQRIHIRREHFDNINLIFFPWNSVTDMPIGSVMIQPKKSANPSLENELKTLSVLDNSYNRTPVTKSTKHWWVRYHQNRHKCHVNLDVNTIFPIQCTSQPTFSDTDISDTTVSSFIVDHVDTMLSMLDELYRTKCPSHSGLCESFTSFEDFRGFISRKVSDFLLEDGSVKISFSTTGSLKFPVEILNKQISSQTKVGEISEDNIITLSPNKVFAYNSNNQPVSLQHQCLGWCPACLQCQTSTTQNIAYHYSPGDIDIVGMFPIHSRGTNPLSCGSITFGMGTDYLTESFLYALHSAKSRYPYLLPGISVGSLIIDTCSRVNSAQQSISNFESCFATFSSLSGKMASPMSVPGYFLYEEDEIVNNIRKSVQSYGKFALSHLTDHQNRSTGVGKLQHSYARSEALSLVSFLSEMDWTYVSVVSSLDDEYAAKATFFMEFATDHNICIHSHLIFDSSPMSYITQSLSSSPVNVVILFLSVDDLKLFFGSKILQKVHILSDTNINWRNTNANIQIPLGSIVLDNTNKINGELQTYLDNILPLKSSRYGNPWLQSFLTERENCRNTQVQQCALPYDIMTQSSKIVLETDLILHALHNKITRLCGHNGGTCKALESFGLSNEDFNHLNFTYQNNSIELSEDTIKNGAFEFSNFQRNGIEQVGHWKDGNMVLLSKNKIRAYNNAGRVLNDLPLSRCFATCICKNINNTDGEQEATELFQDPELMYFESSEKFNRKLWVIVMLAVAGGGVGAAMLFVIYVIYKTCIGVLNKRYIGLGILLLFGIMALYLSVLPYMFTPSETVCAARYLVPAITYALVYATCLTKLMSLRSYKLIGLGGEISNVNQFLTVTFITCLQIAVSVQFVVMKGSFLETQLVRGDYMYACDFDKSEFTLYLIYDMILVVICALYSLTVRKEKKNMGEAVFILISSWINIILWIAWVIVMFTTTRDLVEPTICLGMIVCATVLIMSIFVPKLHKISKLKYDVKKSGMQNGGYKIDTDFMFERPHTLPGGFRNSYNLSPQITKPRSMMTFDASLNY